MKLLHFVRDMNPNLEPLGGNSPRFLRPGMRPDSQSTDVGLQVIASEISYTKVRSLDLSSSLENWGKNSKQDLQALPSALPHDKQLFSDWMKVLEGNFLLLCAQPWKTRSILVWSR